MLSQLIFLSGTSGSGKSVALKALEDAGFYCIDNLPVKLLEYVEFVIHPSQDKVAISLDSRNMPTPAEEAIQLLQNHKSQYPLCQLIYIDATTDTLLSRYSETRRKHPLTDKTTTLREAINQEKQMLAAIADLADTTIDTSKLNTRELHAIIHNKFSDMSSAGGLSILLQSFGFKHGVPHETDFLFDVRCIENPYWNLELRDYTGRDPQIIEFLEQQTMAPAMCQDIFEYLAKWIPNFAKDDRTYLTASIGCTGGKHRSVYITEQLQKHLEKQELTVQVRHRDLK